MKTVITPSYVFNPATRTLDLSAIPNFSIKNLYAVLNQTAGSVIYAAGTSGMGYSSLAGSVLTLSVPTSAMSSSDQLMVIYDDGSSMANLLGGTNVIGYTGTLNIGPISASPQLTTSSAYQLGSSLGGIITFPSIFRTTTQASAIISQLMVRFVSGMASVEIYLFAKYPSTSTIIDNTAVSFTAADLNYLAYPPFTLGPAARTVSSAGYFAYQLLSLSVKNEDLPTTGNLYAVVVAGAVSPILTQYDLTVSISGIQD